MRCPNETGEPLTPTPRARSTRFRGGSPHRVAIGDGQRRFVGDPVLGVQPQRSVHDVEMEVAGRAVDDVLEGVGVGHRDDGPGAPDDPERAVPEADRQGVHDIDGRRALLHERGDPLRVEPGQEQQQGDAVGELRLALATARETRIGVGGLERTVEAVTGAVRIDVGLRFAAIQVDRARSEERLDVDDRADPALRDPASRGQHLFVVVPRVADDDLDARRLGRVDQPTPVRRVEDERLLDEDMDATGDRRRRDGVVMDVRRRDDQRVHGRRRQHRQRVVEAGLDAVALPRPVQVPGIRIGQGDQLGGGVGRQRREVGRPRPVAGPGDADADPVSHAHSFSSCRASSGRPVSRRDSRRRC